MSQQLSERIRAHMERQPRRVRPIRRTRVSASKVTHVPYSADVTDRSIDRAAWARLVQNLLDEETAGNKSRFAAKVGTTYKTVNRWLAEQVDVSEESVRAVARALSLNPADLVVQVGFYGSDELLPAPPAPAERDDEMDLILDADLPESMKRRMIARLGELREQDRRRREETLRWMIDEAKGA